MRAGEVHKGRDLQPTRAAKMTHPSKKLGPFGDPDFMLAEKKPEKGSLILTTTLTAKMFSVS